MYEDIMRRPMFQNAQQRAGSGIMAGGAPVQGFDNGGEAIAFEETYNPEFQRPSDMMDQLSEMREGEGILSRARKGYEDFNEEYDAFVPNIDFENFGSMEQTEGTGINTRDIVDTLIVDYEDPIDVALSGAAAALIMVPPAAAVTSLVRMGYKVNKAQDKVKQLFKVKNDLNKLSDSQKDLNKLSDATEDRGLASILKDKSPGVGEVYAKTQGARIAAMPAQLAAEEEMADGGIAALPVQKFALGGVGLLFNALADLASTQGKKAYDAIADAVIDKSITMKEADELFKIADEIDPNAAEEVVRVGERYTPENIVSVGEEYIPSSQTTPKVTSETLDVPGARPPIRKTTEDDLGIGGKPPEAPDPISSGTKIDDVVDSAEAVSDSKLGRAITYPIRNPIKTTAAGAGVLGATDLATGSNYLSDSIQGVGNFASGVLDDLSKTGDQAEVSALLDMITPDSTDAADAGSTPDRELMGPPLPPGYLSPAEIVQQQRNQPKSDASTSVGKEDDKVKEERKKFLPRVRPFGGKIAKALLGEDEAFGSEDPANQGFLERTISKLQDPRTRYAIAKANQPSEGFATRNAMSDMVLGAQEYDDMIAKRGYLEAQTKDVDRTDTEKLVDYYMDSLKERGDYNEKELAKLKTDLNSLFFAQGQDAQTTSLFATIFDLVPNPEDAISVANKFLTGSQETRKSIQDILAGKKDT